MVVGLAFSERLGHIGLLLRADHSRRDGDRVPAPWVLLQPLGHDCFEAGMQGNVAV